MKKSRKKKARLLPRTFASPDTGRRQLRIRDRWSATSGVSALGIRRDAERREVLQGGLATTRPRASSPSAPPATSAAPTTRIVKAERYDVKSIPPKTSSAADRRSDARGRRHEVKSARRNIKAAQARAGESLRPVPSSRASPKTNPTFRLSILESFSHRRSPHQSQPTSAWASRRRHRTSSTPSRGPSRAGGRIATSWSWTRLSSGRRTPRAPASRAATCAPSRGCSKAKEREEEARSLGTLRGAIES